MATTLTLNDPLPIEKENIIMVKPSQPTPSPILSLSTIDNDPNIELICQTIYVYKSNETSDQDDKLDPASIIKQGLEKALVEYYPLAGRIKRHHEDNKLRVKCNGEGVPFLRARTTCTLSSLNYLYNISIDIAKKFVLEFESKSEDGVHPLMFQVTRFSCGGFTVGMGLSHSICDGFGASQFFRSVAELAAGKEELSVKPVWERERLVANSTHEPIHFPFHKDSLASSPHLPCNDLLHASFDVNAESIRKLKLSSNIMGFGSDTITTLEVLGAFVWRAKFRALEMNLDGKTHFSLAMGLRNILDPPLPKGYYGNAFIGSHVFMDGKDLCEGPLSKVAWAIKEGKKSAAAKEYLMPYLSTVERFNQENKKLEAKGASTVLTDWRHMGLFEVDFGWKNSVNVVPVPWNMFGHVDLLIFLPPFSLDPAMKGGVRVLVCLPRVAMAKFKEEMGSL
ncbi:hypothetical protein J5N97_027017 [Dioscorea zingiberensis]|uniref:Uncharacterized protein n=1 Tax=Dioscorea zingiberensis TaxID=325984 RepID=A0A9D5C4G9_9LILI|nr:hypothetical protein J5N97_027017 [Dioscorea zingiberensis]